MDILLNSNASSSFNSVVDGVETNQNPFVYRYGQNLDGTTLSGISRTFQEVQPQNSPAFNTAVDFHIPKSGLLKNMFVKMKLAKDAGEKSNGAIGALQCSRIQLLTSGRILAEQTAEGLLNKISSQPYESRKVMEKMLNIQGDNDSHGASILCYIPLLFSCVEGMEKVYDTNFVAPLVVRCFVDAGTAHNATSADDTVAVALDSISMSLYCEFIREPAEHQQKRIQADYSDGALQRVQWNELHEFTDKTLSAGDRAMSHEIKTNNYIQEIWVFVDDRTAGTSTIGQPVKLNSVKLEANGQVIADFGNSEDAELLRYIGDLEADKWEYASGNGWDSQAYLQRRYKYSFQLSNDTRKVFGGSASRELSNFKVSVTVDGATTTAHRLHVHIKYAQLESIESASGKVTTSISS
tara:strand:- start:360 stop:1586 length:1227 start_codon:yes stop_codon:yes gene_type:complete